MPVVVAFAGAVEAAELAVDNEVGYMTEVRNTEQVLAQVEDVWSLLGGQLRRRHWHRGLRSLSGHKHQANGGSSFFNALTVESNVIHSSATIIDL